MEAYLERLIQEKSDLEEKSKKLDAFMENEELVNNLLNREQQKLMYQQQAFMEGYYLVLCKRIDIELQKEPIANINVEESLNS